MQRAEPLSVGKAKSMFPAPQHDRLIMSFRDDISAFNGVKLEVIPGKGAINQKINAFLMQYLSKNGIETHFIESINDHECTVSKLKMLPVEAVMRNVAAGSFCKRFNVKLGTELHSPLFELFLKSDALGDPLIRDEHAEYFDWASLQDIQQIKALTFRVNALLCELMRSAGLVLVDFKLEFGRLDGRMVLADEISPDGMRVWDAKTQEIYDKDRFRQDLGDVMTGYKKIAELLKI
jgi:phosphoribosylaminoimidazole-succinocarboxamide synthase